MIHSLRITRRGLDRATMTTQQIQEELDRSIKLSRTNTMTSTEFTVGATDRANKILAFDSSWRKFQ